MEKKAVIQTLKKEFSSNVEMAMSYFRIISTLNSLKLTEREIQILAFTAINGTISSGGRKDKFIETFGASSKPSLGNMIPRLTKKGLLIKNNGRITINPFLELDFSEAIGLKIILKNVDKGQINREGI